MRNILICLSIFFLGCDGVTEINIGPYKPVSNVDDIIMLGNTSHFVAFNYKTKQVEETYYFSKTKARYFAYLSGHLIVSLAGGDRFNVDIATGKVSVHSIPSSNCFLVDDNKRILEAPSWTGKIGSVTYRYDVVENKMVEVVKHPMLREERSYCLEQDGVRYWLANFRLDSIEDVNYEYDNYIMNSAGNTFQLEDSNKISSFIYVKNNFLIRKNIDQTLEKIESLIPLKTKAFFKYPKSNDGYIRQTMMYGNKVLVFTNYELYLLDEAGNILFRWGNYRSEENLQELPKYFAVVSCKIMEDKLYAYGIKSGSENVDTHCFVEIDLKTGQDNWTEVWQEDRKDFYYE